ncbi:MULTISPECIES: response regulator [Pseudomonas]|uniref:Response regulator n=3 Tax=Pseudomonas TaxID=286 RepID=Q88FV9_PSEPK|nr:MULTISPECIES: response regulator [Pseudomonas]AAN69563.1 Response regulator [Pseudomonas putida KT2440]KMU94624.1 chemotaxis protein CheY [Pseudomonas putida]KMY31201.1 chemotaxis protein CheY [Pseudomonas putida]MBP2843025.1 response regulator [Pseudomonas sp. PNP]MCE0868817.1 response regulator [Pseudomonas alloputida]
MRHQVLVVEDDEVLRWLMTEAVTHLGHTVTDCASADDALAILEKIPDLSLVITDIQMPGHIDGLELAKAIWWEHPELPVIIVSGHVVFSPSSLPANARFIKKPCTLDSLSRAMQELLPTR